ncbi:GNAT family N-acetyltransferase [Nakamurella flavida]|uniref:GNAT family N-acetyltransferase n=1 Tax=Nakamurella flavida TaxID=363630 RepID=A0A939C710_9ACTN|nr:GNAT family N-acyltransferase [Nakamurella flavida]MBM9477692.1 GNAT family N-acetyltransferase [Nakamurella flavida]MDP9779244.1 putative hemolysin [Nakamurella flavida]
MSVSDLLRPPTTSATVRATATGTGTPAGRYRLALDTDASDVHAAQRLRHDVFLAEFGSTPDGAGADICRSGRDVDEFDDRCDHLIVWFDTDHGPSQAVATYRLLPPHANDADPRATGLYAHGEFGLAPLESLLDETVEAGRSCVHPDHRRGGAIALLWGGIARYLHLTGHRYLLGCASVPLADGAGNAAAVWDLVRDNHLAPPWRRCRPRRILPLGGTPRPARADIPPLIRGYLRLGAWVCGPPAHDDALGSADFLVLLDLAVADQRYLRRFLGGEAVLQTWDGTAGGRGGLEIAAGRDGR